VTTPPFALSLSLTASGSQDSTPGAPTQKAASPDTRCSAPCADIGLEARYRLHRQPRNRRSGRLPLQSDRSHNPQLRRRVDSLCCCRLSPVAGFHVWQLGRASQCSGSSARERRHQRQQAAGSGVARAWCGEHSQWAGDRTSMTMTQCRNYAVSALGDLRAFSVQSRLLDSPSTPDATHPRGGKRGCHPAQGLRKCGVSWLQ
jgi:hypothetical protein